MNHPGLSTEKHQPQSISIKVRVIATYFGRWPIWFPAFLLSCSTNRTIDWLFFTDCEIPDIAYRNIRFESMTLAELNQLASEKLGFDVQKLTYAQLDLRPAYGVIFAEYIKDVDFWAHCDIDIVWGDISSFITDDILEHYDIVSCRKNFLAGHLTLWRNAPATNNLFKSVPAYQEILSSPEHHSFDECIFSSHIKMQMASNSSSIRVYWPLQMITNFTEKFTPAGWYWENGKIFDANHREHIYIHFQHYKSWERYIDFKIGDEPSRLTFTKHGIKSRRPQIHELLYDKLNWKDARLYLSNFRNETFDSLRVLKRTLRVQNIFWAKKLALNQIDARDVRYDRRSKRLFLKRFDLDLEKEQDFVLEGYYHALRLLEQRQARFFRDEAGELVVTIAGLQLFIQSAEDLVTLKELYIDGIYNVLFSRPTVVMDIGMNVGMTSTFFAGQDDVMVIGFEPCQKQYQQAQRNISMNPSLANKIRTIRTGVGDAEFRTVAISALESANPIGAPLNDQNVDIQLSFQFEEVEIADPADWLETISAAYPAHDIVMKIDCEPADYFIDGISEYQVLKRLHEAGMLAKIHMIMARWHQKQPTHSVQMIAQLLADCGFEILLFNPGDLRVGLLYAVQRNQSLVTQAQDNQSALIQETL